MYVGRYVMCVCVLSMMCNYVCMYVWCVMYACVDGMCTSMLGYDTCVCTNVRKVCYVNMLCMYGRYVCALCMYGRCGMCVCMLCMYDV